MHKHEANRHQMLEQKKNAIRHLRTNANRMLEMPLTCTINSREISFKMKKETQGDAKQLLRNPFNYLTDLKTRMYGKLI